MQIHKMESLLTKLSDATKSLHNLASKIQESNSTSNSHEYKHTELASIKHEEAQHAQVTKELEHTKHELLILKRDIARVSKEKRHAERALKASNSKRLALLASVELMNVEIQELKLKHNNATDEQLQQLDIIKAEGFNFMTSMDSIRDELKRVRDETEELLKAHEVHDSLIQVLNSKILNAKSKLESLTSIESKTDMVALNLVVTLDQLRSEAEIFDREEGFVTEEIEYTKRDIRETEHEIEVKEGKLEAAMGELEAVKLSEFEALGSLRNVINEMMEGRDMASVNESMVTITGFEYGYLTRKAGRAVEVAEKKIDAAYAWVEALKGNEKEVLMKIEMVEREISKLSIEPGPEVEVERAGLGERVVGTGRRSMYRVGSKAGVKRVKLQKFRSSGARCSGKMGYLRKEKVTKKHV